jgi:hypothetical protein
VAARGLCGGVWVLGLPLLRGLGVGSLRVGVAQRGLGGQVGDVLARLFPQFVQLVVVHGSHLARPPSPRNFCAISARAY